MALQQSTSRFWFSLVVAIGVLEGVAGTADPAFSQARKEQTIVTNEEIARLIHQLGDESYAERTNATRRLLAIGAKAMPQLRSAAQADNPEIALRSAHVLETLDALWFAGLSVSLRASKESFSWEEPIDIIVSFSNRSGAASRVPFALGESDLISREGGKLDNHDADQVGHMLDMADFLRVTSSDGKMVELKVDEIAADPEVVASVQKRLSGDIVGSLESGSTNAVTLASFNRGWARYPMLDEGEYILQFIYAPAWDDERLSSDRVGWVQSDPITIRVTHSAPATVSRHGVEASVEIARDGGDFVASLVNQSDQPTWVNVNFGATAPFVQAGWVYAKDSVSHDRPIAMKSGQSWKDFDPDRIVQLQPGATIELARLTVEDAKKILIELNGDPSRERWTVHFTYSNPCDRAWQARQGAVLLDNDAAPAILRSLLPKRMMASRQSSNRLVIASEP